MAHIILIPSAFHSGQCWNRVVPLLEAAGHVVFAPDLPGTGQDGLNPADVDLATWAEFVADLCRAVPEPVIVVGHSRGGIVISAAAELVPDRISRLVYVAAFIIPSGQSLFGAISAMGPMTQMPFEVSPDGRVATFAGGGARGIFYSQIDQEQADAQAAHLRPEPLLPSTTPLSLTEACFGSVPKAYIRTTKDDLIPPAAQEAMARAAQCEPIIPIDTDHSPFFSAPEQLAELIDTIICTDALHGA
ncbi:alpha/beta fold hydrolase [Sphingobium lactosutens]|uniref:AB hydrolase-1 domain-containing protein n=1 Tax=Sphingobium lactosutens DS20 TaxID=1331060 RepID=T0HAT5_9SPHN|nr:alpha/beta fold hydrolase [Sphingobium lactosutens]EQB13431.1 hypothetical protein RLDS_17005 [Sphingobium lactosutens DS20]